MKVSRRFLCALIIVSTLWPIISWAQIDWPQIKLTTVVSGLSLPTHVTNAADGSNRLFIVEQAGKIKIWKNGAMLSAPFLDITNKIDTNGERGLLSVAFPPNYQTKRYFYVDYARKSDSAIIISRFAVSSDDNIAAPATEQVLLTIPKSTAYHNGGQIMFGPDGYLYIGVGDDDPGGDLSNNAQNTSLLVGKILRIDVESGSTGYSIPPNNPFVGNPNYRPEIWAVGLRNPWRFSFDRATGDFYIGDVGENSWEEVDFQAAGDGGGENYGWPIREGNHDFRVPSGFDVSSLTSPVAEYSHQNGHAITGGFVYRGPSINRMNGVYIYGDSYLGYFFAAKKSGEIWQSQNLNFLSPATTSFGEGEDGRLYAADLSGVVSLVEDSLVADQPIFSPPGGTYNDVVPVRISSDSNATIYYTTDGTTPTTSSPSIVAGQTVTLSAGATLKAKAVKTGLTDSAITSAAYVLQVAIPQFSPPVPFAPQTGPTQVSIGTLTPNATIHYTLDGTAPTASSPTYFGSFTISPPVVLNAKAFRDGFTPSTTIGSFLGLLIPEKATVTTLAGDGTQGYLDGAGITARFWSPAGLCLDSAGNVYVADIGNNAIRKITAAGQVSTLAGGSLGFVNGPGTTAKFYNPKAICIDTFGNLFVTDQFNYAIRKVTLDGNVSTVAGGSSGNTFNGYIEVDTTGTLFAGAWGRIKKISGGAITIFAGPGAGDVNTGWQNGVGVGIDGLGNLYVSSRAGMLSAITPLGSITTFAGNFSTTGFCDGPKMTALFSNAQDVCVDRLGNAYVADSNRVRKIRPNGIVTTLATLPNTGSFPTSAGLCVDGNGVVYVTDSTNRVRKITPVDWDEDGIPDAEEGGTTPYIVGVDDRLVDSDGDGQSNAAEYLAGTDPQSASSFFNVRNIYTGNGEIGVEWNSIPNRNYQVQFSDDLKNWTNLSGIISGTGSLLSFSDSTALGKTRGFYRVSVSLP